MLIECVVGLMAGVLELRDVVAGEGDEFILEIEVVSFTGSTCKSC